MEILKADETIDRGALDGRLALQLHAKLNEEGFHSRHGENLPAHEVDHKEAPDPV